MSIIIIPLCTIRFSRFSVKFGTLLGGYVLVSVKMKKAQSIIFFKLFVESKGLIVSFKLLQTWADIFTVQRN